MNRDITDIFFALLRYALGSDEAPIAEPLTADQWKQIFSLSKKQALMGVIYSGVQRLPENLLPQSDLMDRWSQLVVKIMAGNSLMNGTAAKLTQMFAERGAHSVILKGQANALLYPDPYVRQAGDIDILVAGGRKGVIALLREMGYAENLNVSKIHAHLDPKLFGGISIEVHFWPTFSYSPIKNKKNQKFFDDQFAARKVGSEGFFVPSITYALVMQMSHLFHHFFEEGVGLRQLVDYNYLLCHSSAKERSVAIKQLKKMGLYRFSSSVMWIMEAVLDLDGKKMLCSSNEKLGSALLDSILDGGNFGRYSTRFKLPVIVRWSIDRVKFFRRCLYSFSEALWYELYYAGTFFRFMPKRIEQRKISVRKLHR